MDSEEIVGGLKNVKNADGGQIFLSISDQNNLITSTNQLISPSNPFMALSYQLILPIGQVMETPVVLMQPNFIATNNHMISPYPQFYNLTNQISNPIPQIYPSNSQLLTSGQGNQVLRLVDSNQYLPQFPINLQSNFMPGTNTTELPSAPINQLGSIILPMTKNLNTQLANEQIYISPNVSELMANHQIISSLSNSPVVAAVQEKVSQNKIVPNVSKLLPKTDNQNRNIMGKKSIKNQSKTVNPYQSVASALSNNKASENRQVIAQPKKLNSINPTENLLQPIASCSLIAKEKLITTYATINPIPINLDIDEMVPCSLSAEEIPTNPFVTIQPIPKKIATKEKPMQPIPLSFINTEEKLENVMVTIQKLQHSLKSKKNQTTSTSINALQVRRKTNDELIQQMPLRSITNPSTSAAQQQQKYKTLQESKKPLNLKAKTSQYYQQGLPTPCLKILPLQKDNKIIEANKKSNTIKHETKRHKNISNSFIDIPQKNAFVEIPELLTNSSVIKTTKSIISSNKIEFEQNKTKIQMEKKALKEKRIRKKMKFLKALESRLFLYKKYPREHYIHKKIVRTWKYVALAALKTSDRILTKSCIDIWKAISDDYQCFSEVEDLCELLEMLKFLISQKEGIVDKFNLQEEDESIRLAKKNDKRFLIGLLPDIRLMTEKQMKLFKKAAIKLIHELCIKTE